MGFAAIITTLLRRALFLIDPVICNNEWSPLNATLKLVYSSLNIILNIYFYILDMFYF
jgi:hypothetical protein